jgi:hypothetical protein
MAVDHVVRQAERQAELAHLVLEQLAQRLEQLQAERLGQAADVVVALDRLRLLGLGAARLDDVGIDRALGQPLRLLQLAGGAGEHLDELAADDLALLLRIGDAGELAEELLAGVDGDHLRVQPVGEHLHHHAGLVEAQQPVVDEDAGQPVADGAVDQRRGDARVDAAREAEDHLVAADLVADPRHRLVDVVAHHPVGPGTADVEDEALEQLATLHRVGDLGMELHAVVAAALVGHAGDRAARRRCHQAEAGRQRRDLVAVAHPHLEHAVALGGGEVLEALQQPGVAARADLGVAELAVGARLDLPAELHRHREHAVADAQHRHAELEHRLRRAQLVLLVGRGVAARQDDSLRPELADEGVTDVVRMDLAEDVRLADAPGDQLCHLRAEIENQDPVMHGASSRSQTGRASDSRSCRALPKWSQARPSATAWIAAQK